jgi:GntR family transcriptional regulator/MocR family aminotransferase
MGAELLLLPLDSQGLEVERLADAVAAPKLIYTTPCHQDPTGVVMSPARRTALLKWCKLNNVLILEDDFDSAFRYGKKSIPPLACDGDGQVIYMYGFWKILFPVCRIGCIVVPPHLVPLYRRARSLTEREFDFVGHEALCEFLSDGHLDRHLRKVRGLYRSRRAAVALVLTQLLGGQIEIADAEAGTNLLVKFAARFNEEVVLDCAQKAGLAVVTLSVYYRAAEPEIQQYLIPLGQAPEDQLAATAASFAQLLLG